MKLSAFILAALLPFMAYAGSYEDLEAALIRTDSDSAIDLIKHGMDVNTVDSAGNTILIQAVRQDMTELITYLIGHRARLNTRNKNGETALSIAAYTGKLSYVKQLVEAGAAVNFYGWSPLAYASYTGHFEVADYLIKHGAEVNAKTENGSTALFFAARFGHEDIIELLLANKADATVANDRGETAVDWAANSKNTDIEAILRSAGGRSGKSVVLDLAK